MKHQRPLFRAAAATLAVTALVGLTGCESAPETPRDDTVEVPQGVTVDETPTAGQLGPDWQELEDGPNPLQTELCKTPAWGKHPKPAHTGTAHYLAPTGEPVSITWASWDSPVSLSVNGATQDCLADLSSDKQTVTSYTPLDAAGLSLEASASRLEDNVTTSTGLLLAAPVEPGAPHTGLTPDSDEPVYSSDWAVISAETGTESEGTQFEAFARRILAAAVRSRTGEHVNPVPAPAIIGSPAPWLDDEVANPDVPVDQYVDRPAGSE